MSHHHRPPPTATDRHATDRHRPPPSVITAASSYGYIAEDSAAAPLLQRMAEQGRCYVYTHEHPHFVIRLATRPGIPRDSIVLTAVQVN